MADRFLHELPDREFEIVLRGLEPAIAWPTAAGFAGGLDLAAIVGARIEAMPAPGDRLATPRFLAWRGWSWRPARRALVLALVALLALAAIAAALGLGLPGLRILLGQAPTGPPASTSPTVEPSRSTEPEALGESLRLGDALDPLDPDGLEARAGFPVRLPADPAIGPPDAAYIDDLKGGQVTVLWATRPGLPATLEPEVGLLLSQFRGTVGNQFFAKATGADTTIEPVEVAGRAGYWLSGDPHIFFWEGTGGFVDDSRRWVGDVLLWSDGPVTYRLETALGRDEAIRIAESLP